MIGSMQQLWQRLARPRRGALPRPAMPDAVPPAAPIGVPLDIAPNDPLVAYFLSTPGATEISRLRLDSPALQAMQAAGVSMAVPLVSQGDLIGVLTLGPRLSQQEYSAADRALLANLASQTAPALRVAQLVRQQQAEARLRERIDQELRVARLIQQTLLPRELPALSGWRLAAYYQPAREVGGDFYDFLTLPGNRLGLVVGDVTDKGVPAALVMSSVRSLLRTSALSSDAPGAVLEKVNDLLTPDIPPNMFVTCFYAILDPASGRLRYANAGHDLPYQRQGTTVIELRATGMPLGLMPGMRYEEAETVLTPGDRVLFYSDGLVEAHDPTRQMFGFPRLRALLAGDPVVGDQSLVDWLLTELAGFTGPDWEQEDDITLVTLERAALGAVPTKVADQSNAERHCLVAFEVPSQPGIERLATARVAAAVEPLGLPPGRLERLKTAVAEATMNAAEHGNQFRPETPIMITVLAGSADLVVRITDQGGGPADLDLEQPDLEAKLEGRQGPRGWGLFLIRSLVDTVTASISGAEHTIELVLQRESGGPTEMTP